MSEQPLANTVKINQIHDDLTFYKMFSRDKVNLWLHLSLCHYVPSVESWIIAEMIIAVVNLRNIDYRGIL